MSVLFSVFPHLQRGLGERLADERVKGSAQGLSRRGCEDEVRVQCGPGGVVSRWHKCWHGPGCP